MKAIWKTMLATICLLGASLVTASAAWEVYPGLRSPGWFGIVIGDFDGDGTVETTVTSSIAPDASYYARVLSVLAADGPGEYSTRAVSILPERLIGSIVRTPREDQADRLASIMGEYGAEQVVVLGGIPARLLRTIETPMVRKIFFIADVDADGRQEIVASTDDTGYGHLVVLDYETGAVEWVGPDGVLSIVAAQLDTDAALELILGSTPGVIIDGASHAIDWEYQGGFYRTVLAGRFSTDANTRTFAVVREGSVRIFRSEPYALMWEFPINFSEVAAIANPTFDGLDQIAISTFGRLSIHDPRNGQISISINGVFAENFAFFDLDRDNHAEIIFRDTYPSSGDWVKVIDLATLADEYVQAEAVGGYSEVVRGDISGDGSDRVAYLTFVRGQLGFGPTIRILDADTGRTLREHHVISSGTFDYHLSLAQLDADAPMEFVLTNRNPLNGDAVVVIDGATFAEQWRVDVNSPYFYSVEDVAFVDRNADGVKDVVLVESEAGARVVVRDGRTGDILWQSVTLNDDGSTRIAAFHSTTGTPQVLVVRGIGIYLFDLTTGLLADSATNSAGLTGLWQWGDYAGCRFATLDAYSTVSVYRCAELEQIGTYSVPQGTTFFRPVYGSSPRFLVASGSRLYVSDAQGAVFPASSDLGYQMLGAGNQGVLRPGFDEDHYDLVIGSDYMVTRLAITATDVVFANGFD